MLITFLVFALVSFLALMVALFVLYPKKKKLTTVPGLEPSDDTLGNLTDVKEAGSFYEFLQQLHQELGPVASFWIRDKYCISIASAAAFKDVQHLFDRAGVFFEFALPLIGAKSIQMTNGEIGRQRHRIYSETLSHPVCCKLLPKFVKIAKDLVEALKQKPDDEHIPVHAYMMAIAIKMISTTQFGAYFREDTAVRHFHNLYESIMDDMNDIFEGTLTENDRENYQKFETKLSSFKATVREIIETQKQARNAGDYEDAPLLNAILDNAIDDEEAMCDVITFFVGGFHTTGNFISWIFYHIAIAPEIQKKLIVEIDSVMGGQDLNEAFAAQLTYTWQVLEEGLRISVTGPFAARQTPDHEIRIQGHLIPPRTSILCAVSVALNDPNVFQDPGKFDPDRFSPDAVKKRPSLAFAPFGLGQRRCPGYKFSRFEALTVLVTILQNFSFKPAFENDYFVEQHFGTVITKPETEIWINVKSRSKKYN